MRRRLDARSIPSWMRPGRALTWERVENCIRCTSHALNSDGYPRIDHHSKSRTIARIILSKHIDWELSREIVSRHTCDNRWCIRPDHIIAGTHLDNVRDRDERGRTAKGVMQYCAKLNPEKVREIRQLSESGMSGREIARHFGMGKSPIARIIRGERWKHVT